MSADDAPAFVVDASVILKWVLGPEREPDHASALELLDSWRRDEIELVVPTLWIYEVGNVLALKRPKDAAECLGTLIDLGLREVALDQALAARATALAQAHKVTFYDAAYLAVADAIGATLVTADAKFVEKLPLGTAVRKLASDL